jgi:thiol:disulfide interchange protein DsbD
MRSFVFLFLLALGLPAFAQKVESVATLIPEVSSVAAGETFTIALKLEHPPEWHSYYKNSGGVELPPEIKWELPEGASAGEIQWPTPEIKDGYGGKSFVYNGSPVFLVEIDPGTSVSAGDSFTFTANADWQICKLSCINENATFTMSLPVAESSEIDPKQIEFFALARSEIPVELPDSVKVSVLPSANPANSIQLQLDGLEDKPTDFIPNEPYLKPLSAAGEVTATDQGFLLTLERKKVDFLDEPIPQGDSVTGILVGERDYKISQSAASEVSKPEEPASAGKSLSINELLSVLGGMFLGGLILNLMPCVFPVIGLKIMGFVQQAGEDRRSIALHGVSFTVGVLASFGVLSGILFAVRAAALKSGGDSIGWGYQLQNPIVVLVLLLLMFILGLNLFGIFELGTSATSVGGKLQNKSGHTGSFFSGVLATVVATPCSGPFLGVAIGATMALPAVQFFAGFTAMALGLALPYLVLSIFPSLVEKLPRPGAWMESFKQGMSFLLFGTAGYLLWVYSGLIGQEALLAPLLGLTLVAVGAWVYGRWYLPHRSRSVRTSGLVIAVGLVVAGIFISLPPKEDKLWQTWSEAKVESLLSEGTPVYIDFTAQWCFTCQVNKKVAYTKEVVALAKKKGIVFLKADKTRPNPAIEARLEELGRTAIPVNVLMIPGEEPVITSELLTPGYLIKLFETVPE